MKGACGIDIDKDKAFMAFATISKARVVLLKEIVLDIGWNGFDFVSYVKKHSQLFENKIKENEKELDLQVDAVFVNLPHKLESCQEISTNIPLKRLKKITDRDIEATKHHIETAVLDWDDFCLHHFIPFYQIEDQDYNFAPLGVLATKLKTKSILVSVKDQFYKSIAAVFENSGRSFGGFSFWGASSLALGLNNNSSKKTVIAIDIRYDAAHCLIHQKQNIISDKFDFGFQKILQDIANKFSISVDMAYEIFSRYVGFGTGQSRRTSEKEITVKNGDVYASISLTALNVFIADYLKRGIEKITVSLIERYGSTNIELIFTGRLSATAKFYDFVRSFTASDIKIIPTFAVISSSFGCLKYGVNPFLEHDHLKDSSLFKRLQNIYQEYF